MSENIGLFVLRCVAYEIATGCRKIVMKYEFGNTYWRKRVRTKLGGDFSNNTGALRFQKFVHCE